MSRMQVNRGELAQNLRRIGSSGTGAAEKLGGFFPLPLAGQHTGQGLQDIDRVWAQVQGSSKVFLGQGEFTLAFPRPAQRKEQLRSGRLLFLSYFKKSESIVREIETQQRLGELHPQSGILRCAHCDRWSECLSLRNSTQSQIAGCQQRQRLVRSTRTRNSFERPQGKVKLILFQVGRCQTAVNLRVVWRQTRRIQQGCEFIIVLALSMINPCQVYAGGQ